MTDLRAWVREREQEVLSPLTFRPMTDALRLRCGHQIGARDLEELRRAGHDHCLSCLSPIAKGDVEVPCEPTRRLARAFEETFGADGCSEKASQADQLTFYARGTGRPAPTRGPSPSPTTAAAADDDDVVVVEREAAPGRSARPRPPPWVRPIPREPAAAEADGMDDVLSQDFAALGLFPGSMPPRRPPSPAAPASPARTRTLSAQAPEWSPTAAPPAAPPLLAAPHKTWVAALLWEAGEVVRGASLPARQAATLAHATGILERLCGPGEKTLTPADAVTADLRERRWAEARWRILAWSEHKKPPASAPLVRAIVHVWRALAFAAAGTGSEGEPYHRLIRLLDALRHR